MSLNILLVEHDSVSRARITGVLRQKAHVVRPVATGEEAMAQVSRGRAPDLVIADLDPADLAELRAALPPDSRTELLMIRDDPDDPRTIAAMRESLADLLVRPFELGQLINRISAVDRRVFLEEELRRARAALSTNGEPALVGQSMAVRRVLDVVDAFGPSGASVLITGESGTGKELVARMLHRRSARANKPLVSVNCAALPETLFEAELFGHERGAFTGAATRRDGRFKAADGGTLFLDEVAEIPIAAQGKLVRVLQEGTFEPLGTNRAVRVDVRIFSATNRDLQRCVVEGTFRQDLFYRVNTLPLSLPPLRERAGDLPLLVDHFLRRFASDGRVPALTEAAWSALSAYPFPGNVRELEHAVQHAVVMSRGARIDVIHLPKTMVETAAELAVESPSGFRHLHPAVRDFERNHIVRALQLAHGRKGEAAMLLGISRKNLWEKMRAHGLLDSLRSLPSAE